MKVLVTGGAGYIGSHTVRRLLEEGHEVVVIDNLEKGHRTSLDQGVNFYKGDIRDSAFLNTVLDKESGIEGCIHFAAYSQVGESMEKPIKYYDNNVSGSVNLIKFLLLHGIKKIVFSSTAAVYGEPEEIPIKENSAVCPVNTYGETKLSVESLIRRSGSAYGFKYVILRYFNACGAHPNGDIGEDHDPETHLIPLVLKAAGSRKKDVTIFGTDYDTEDGTCIRDYIHVMDLADAHIKALLYLAKGSKSQTINLGLGRGFSEREIIDSAKRVTGRDIKVIEGKRRKGDPAVLVASNEKAREILSWEPYYTEIDSIMETAWKWHKGHPKGYNETIKDYLSNFF